MVVGTYPHRGSIKWYLAQPRVLPQHRSGEAEFSYVRCYVPSRSISYPGSMRMGWRVLYKGQAVIEVETMKEVKQFIKEKLES